MGGRGRLPRAGPGSCLGVIGPPCAAHVGKQRCSSRRGCCLCAATPHLEHSVCRHKDNAVLGAQAAQLLCAAHARHAPPNHNMPHPVACFFFAAPGGPAGRRVRCAQVICRAGEGGGGSGGRVGGRRRQQLADQMRCAAHANNYKLAAGGCDMQQGCRHSQIKALPISTQRAHQTGPAAGFQMVLMRCGCL